MCSRRWASRMHTTNLFRQQPTVHRSKGRLAVLTAFGTPGDLALVRFGPLHEPAKRSSVRDKLPSLTCYAVVAADSPAAEISIEMHQLGGNLGQRYQRQRSW